MGGLCVTCTISPLQLHPQPGQQRAPPALAGGSVCGGSQLMGQQAAALQENACGDQTRQRVLYGV